MRTLQALLKMIDEKGFERCVVTLPVLCTLCAKC
jgi:hypothetical protein